MLDPCSVMLVGNTHQTTSLAAAAVAAPYALSEEKRLCGTAPSGSIYLQGRQPPTEELLRHLHRLGGHPNHGNQTYININGGIYPEDILFFFLLFLLFLIITKLR
jgi:hypothetical protein